MAAAQPSASARAASSAIMATPPSKKASASITARRERYGHRPIKATHEGSCPTKCKRKCGSERNHGHTPIKAKLKRGCPTKAKHEHGCK